MRRRERKQFKVDRAQAFLNASLAAEAILKAKSSNSADVPSAAMEEPNHDLARTSSRTSLASPAPVVTAADKQSKMLDSELYDLPEGVTRLTPQTFLQRPTRPGVRPAGLGRQAPPSGQADPARSGDQSTAEGSAKAEELGEEDQEHLQLNMEEAFFLCWAIGCLRVLNKETVSWICFPNEKWDSMLM
jgi:tRNA-splicing endonuclease subunit Sen2